jgi:hypothetical protein
MLHQINRKLVNKYGYKHQLLKINEEINELVSELINETDSPEIIRQNIIEELADVEITSQQKDIIFHHIMRDYNISYDEITEQLEKKLIKIKEVHLDE